MKNKVIILILSFCLAVLSVTLFKLKKSNVTLSDIPEGEDFIIQTTTGEEFDLSKKRGKVIILYFGYTFCPDICPTTLSTVGVALNKFTTDELKHIETLFIGVDTKRDTLVKLKEYSAFFHPTIVGGSTTADKTKEIATIFGVNYVVHEPEPGKSYYVVDHSTQLLILNKKGKIAELVPHGESADIIYQTVLKYLKEKI